MRKRCDRFFIVCSSRCFLDSNLQMTRVSFFLVLFLSFVSCELSVFDASGHLLLKLYAGRDSSLLFDPSDAVLSSLFVNVSSLSSWVACSAKQEASKVVFELRVWGTLDRPVACELISNGVSSAVLISSSDLDVKGAVPPTVKQTPPPKVDPNALIKDEKSFAARFWWLLILPPMLLLLR